MSLTSIRRLFGVSVGLFFSFVVSPSQAQTFTSNSNGSDGALNYPTPGTYYFDPKAFNPPLNPAGDNVFNFTTINIGTGVVLKLSSKILTGPIYWLAQGAVIINGSVDLSGENGHVLSNTTSLRVPAAGGAGGYGGGVGGALTGFPLPEPGNGPGGGTAPTTAGAQGTNGSFTGSQYLIPLIGGSGGSGGITNGPTTFGAGGGGGGGAILIASNVSITLGGSVIASGGNAGNGGPPYAGAGSGGAVRLIAPIISDHPGTGDGPCAPFGNGHGLVRVNGGGGGQTAGVNGIMRLEANTLAMDLGDCEPSAQTSAPFNVSPPATPPSVLKVTSIVTPSGTFAINANPFSFPDAVINSSGPVTLNVQAQYIPAGTVPKILIMSETGPDQPVNCSPLSGQLQLSTCSASITFPTGGSRGFVKATW